ncbi:MAG: DUF2240 family protein [Candidatus Asgardarchaeia archaeon]
MILSLDEIIEAIINETGLTRKEIFERIKAIKEELGAQFISDEGAAHIVARELGVNVFSSLPQDVTVSSAKIKDLQIGDSYVTLIGKVINIFGVREYTKKDGSKGKIGKIVIADDTGMITVVLWNDKAEILETRKIKRNDVVRIDGGIVKESLTSEREIHIGLYGSITVTDEEVNALPEVVLNKKKISEISVFDYGLEIEGTLTRKFKKTTFKQSDGKLGDRLAFIFSDESGQILCVAWNDAAKLIDSLEEGTQLRLTNVRSRKGIQGKLEIHIDSDKSIVVLKRPLKQKEKSFSKLTEILPSDVDINTIVKVISEPKLTTFTRKDGTTGKRLVFTVADETGKMNVIAWNDLAEQLKDVTPGTIIEINHCNVRINRSGFYELVLNQSAVIKKISDNTILEIDETKLPYIRVELPVIKIEELKPDTFVRITGIIVNMYNKLVLFEACPKCGTKLEHLGEKWVCPNCGEIKNPKKKIAITITVDDESGVIPVTLIGDVAEEVIKLSANEISQQILENTSTDEIISDIKSRLLGNYIIVDGKVQINRFTNNLELIAKRISNVDPEKETEIILKEIIEKNSH